MGFPEGCFLNQIDRAEIHARNAIRTELSNSLSGIGLTLVGDWTDAALARCLVSHFYGKAWQRLEDACFVDKSLSYEEYVTTATKMIREYSRAKFSERFERKLLELQRD